jgi:hypothetical protein
MTRAVPMTELADSRLLVGGQALLRLLAVGGGSFELAACGRS